MNFRGFSQTFLPAGFVGAMGFFSIMYSLNGDFSLTKTLCSVKKYPDEPQVPFGEAMLLSRQMLPTNDAAPAVTSRRCAEVSACAGRSLATNRLKWRPR